MNSSSAKIALVPLVLAATWATAQADNFVVSVTPSAGHTLDNLEVFSALTTTTTSTNPGTTTQTNEALTPSLGSVGGATTFSTTISTSYGTSTSTGGAEDGTDATFGLLATSNGFAVLGGSSMTTGTNYSTQYGSTGVTQSQALAGIQNGSLSVASALFPNTTTNAIYTASDVTTPTVGNFYAFNADGVASQIGTWSVSAAPVPEPASLAAVGVGALTLVRRRRKLG